MIRPHRVLVTTTPSLEGWTIDSYLGPVTAHVVAGAGFVSDVFASFSDVFGGRSHSYQKQLHSIKAEALRVLQEEAAAIGGNCVVGLHLDHDEVSGGGKSMFMVTAVGTAVVATRHDREGEHPSTDAAGLLTAAQLNDEVRRRRLIEHAQAGTLELNRKEVWDSITEFQVVEAAPTALSKFASWLTASNVAVHGPFDTSWVSTYIGSLPAEDAKGPVYDVLMNPEIPGAVSEAVSKLVLEAGLLDINRINRMLESGEFEVRRRGVQMLKYMQPIYSEKDIASLQETLNLLESRFPEVVERHSKKTMFSGKERPVWKCLCGGDNSEEKEECSGCGRDVRGFRRQDSRPEQVAEPIRRQLEVLSDLATPIHV